MSGGFVGTPQGPVPAITPPNVQDYPRLVATLPYFEPVAIAEIIQPSVQEAVEAVLPSLIPPYIQPAVDSSIQAQCVLLVGSTMTGALNLQPAMPTAPTMAATKEYVDTMVATSVPEVPPVPAGQAWARETGQWVPGGSGTVTNIATGTGLTGGPITATGTIALANMAANSIKGNNTGAAAAPADIPAGNVLTMIGAAPLNSPVFIGTPVLPTGATGVTQPVSTSNTTLATTAFVATAVGSYLPLTGGILAGPGNLTARGGVLVGAAGAVPSAGGLTLNSNTVAPPPLLAPVNVEIVGADNTGAALQVDCFSAANTPALVMRRSRGTAAAPTAVQSGDVLGYVLGQGRGATTYSAQVNIGMGAVENWTDAARGANLSIATTPAGSTAAVNSLILSGNTAALSGNLAIGVALPSDLASASVLGGSFEAGPAGGSLGIAFNIYTASGGGFKMLTAAAATAINMSGGVINFFSAPSAAAGAAPAFASTLSSDNLGDLTISGPTATKASGTTWANPSAREIKQDIQPYDKGIAAVLALNPVTYRFAEGSGFSVAETHVGLIHDETAHMPEMHRTVTIGRGMEHPGREVDGLDCSAITFALINAIKDLNYRLSVLEGRA